MSNYYEPVRASDELAGLRKRQSALMAILEDGFDQEIYRRLNLINHKIEVAQSREQGLWNKEHVELVSVPGRMKTKLRD